MWPTQWFSPADGMNRASRGTPGFLRDATVSRGMSTPAAHGRPAHQLGRPDDLTAVGAVVSTADDQEALRFQEPDGRTFAHHISGLFNRICA
jgi:hypothetical protein